MSSLASTPRSDRSDRGRTIQSLVGLRAILSAAVVLIHLAPFAGALVPVSAPAWNAIWRHGYAALDLFFVLSGFVITAGYRSVFTRWAGWGTVGRFLWARLSRFYPLHLAVLAALVAAVLLGRAVGVDLPHGGDLGTDLVSHVLLVQGWGGAHALTWNGPTWSLSAEWLCYLAVPLLVPLVLRLRDSRGVVGVYLLAVALPIVAYSFLGFDDAEITYRAPLFRVVGGFVAGMALNQLCHVRSRLPDLAGRLAGVLALLSVAGVVGLVGLGVPELVILPLSALTILALAQQRGTLDRVLGSRPFRPAGDLSVSLFMTHVPWLLAASVVVNPRTFPGAWGWLGTLVLLGGAVLVALVALVTVERPTQRIMRELVGRPRRADAEPAARPTAVKETTS